MADYYVITAPGEGEYIDRKSRFIGHAMPISGEPEAVMLIDQIKRKYWDARHNCYAYVTGDNGSITRCSDDGEPSGTAGRPILDCITGADLRDTLVVVTRYFGGTLLGTGGLVRAYTQATRETLADARISRMRAAARLSVKTDYNSAEKIRRYLETQADVKTEDTVYADSVEMILTVAEEVLESCLDGITQAANGKAQVSVAQRGFYPI